MEGISWFAVPIKSLEMWLNLDLSMKWLFSTVDDPIKVFNFLLENFVNSKNKVLGCDIFSTNFKKNIRTTANRYFLLFFLFCGFYSMISKPDLLTKIICCTSYAIMVSLIWIINLMRIITPKISIWFSRCLSNQTLY